MPDYRYLVFPSGPQPTEDEAAQLRGMAKALSRRSAIGRERSTDALVIAFDAEVFDRTIASHIGFERLVRRWQRRGCHVVDHLKFVKDPAALRPEPIAKADSSPELPLGSPSSPRMLALKELAAKEALGRSLLHVQQTLQRHEALVRLGKWMPYLMMALAALGTICGGLYVGMRLSRSETEPRRVNTERVIESLREPSAVAPADNADSRR